jgi:hypothetical protein
VLAERLLDINPELNLTVIPEYIKDERMIEILDCGYDYVVDAIDTLSPKIFLIHHTVNREMRLVSSMGSGGKFDPEKIRVTDISETTDCTLARILRKKLHRLGVREGPTPGEGSDQRLLHQVLTVDPVQREQARVPDQGSAPRAHHLGQHLLPARHRSPPVRTWPLSRN